MIYNVYLDGVNIYDAAENMTLLNPSLKIELNAAGSLEFTMPVFHKYYDLPKLMTSDVEVYENGELIWYGRVVEMNVAMNKNKTVYCEGPFAFFNDSIQRPVVYDAITVRDFFSAVISNHNAWVPVNRQFTVGNVTVSNSNVYRELNYDKTIDAINTMCLNAEGGYLFFRKEDGVNYVDWLADITGENTQPVQFGLNLVDISQHMNGSDIRTAILPLGAETNGVKLTISDGNNGLDYLEDSTAVSLYGRIPEVVEFDDIKYVDALIPAARKWLTDAQFDPLTIECDAAELHYLDNSYSPFRVGQGVKVTSTPHLIDKVLPLTKMSVKLDSGVKKISVGTPEKRDLSEIYKPSSDKSTSSSHSNTGSQGQSTSYSSTNYNDTLSAADWSGSYAPYTQTITLSGISADDQPIIDVAADNIYQINQWGYVSKADTSSGSITFYCFENKPTIDLPIKIKVI